MSAFIDLAYKVAKRSTHPKHRMSAVLYRGGAILSVATNTGEWGQCCERRAIKPYMDLRGATLLVVRSNKKLSYPCPECRKVIKEVGIKKIIYIDNNGNVQKIKARDL